MIALMPEQDMREWLRCIERQIRSPTPSEVGEDKNLYVESGGKCDDLNVSRVSKWTGHILLYNIVIC